MLSDPLSHKHHGTTLNKLTVFTYMSYYYYYYYVYNIYTKVSIIVVVLYHTIIIICFHCTWVVSLFAYDIILYNRIPLCRYKLCNRISLGVLKKLQYEGYVPKLGKNSILINQVSCTMNEKYAPFRFSLSFYYFSLAYIISCKHLRLSIIFKAKRAKIIWKCKILYILYNICLYSS